MFDREGAVFLLAGGEIVLGLLAFRILWWVIRGWERGLLREPPFPHDPEGPHGPEGGRPALSLVRGDEERRPERPDQLRQVA